VSDGKYLPELYDEINEVANSLNALAEEITERLEQLTEGGPAWYPGTRARVEARAALEPAEEFGRALEKLGECWMSLRERLSAL
jgi:hypothetical protein